MAFKWTQKTVSAVNWKKKTPLETLDACVEHWEERIAAGRYDPEGHDWFDYDYKGVCAACKKWAVSPVMDCGDCPLAPFCCNGLWQKMDGTREAAVAVLDYIKKVRSELVKDMLVKCLECLAEVFDDDPRYSALLGKLRNKCSVPKQPPPWELKVGDWVEYKDGFCEGRGKIISDDAHTDREPFDFVVADPTRNGYPWHNCGLSNEYTRLFPNSCRWFYKNNLKPAGERCES